MANADQIWRAVLLLVAAVGFSGCGEPKPSVFVEDPRAYLIEKVQEAELHASWEVYRNRDAEFVAGVVDEEISKMRKELPTDSKKLDRLVGGAVMRFRINSIKSEVQRELILKKAQARFESPPMAVYTSMMGAGTTQMKIALLDYDLLPGEWRKPVRGGGMDMEDSPAIEGVDGLKQEVFQAALNRLHTNHPDVDVYQIRCSFYYGSSQHRLLYQVGGWGGVAISGTDARRDFATNSTTLEDLLKGNLKLADLKWSKPTQSNGGPVFYSLDRAALPSL